MFEHADIIVVGAGFYGAVIAEQAAASGLKVIVIDKRPHIGGNAYSEVDAETGIEIHKYGPHFFHTSNTAVWNYLQRFTQFNAYQHRGFTRHNNRTYSLPINLATMCQFFEKSLSPDEAKILIGQQRSEARIATFSNLEDKAIALIGRPLYEAFIQGYTKKQWQTDPKLLPESIITRLPVRFDFNNRYFNDTYEGLPLHGYTTVFNKMLAHENIEVKLGLDYFDLRSQIRARKTVVYTGPIDRYFNYAAGELKWRTVDFSFEVENTGDFQGTSVMNFADEDVPYTRIVEYRHLHPERNYQTEKTIISKEFSRNAGKTDEPYYPVAIEADKRLYGEYKALTLSEKNIFFGGRLGTYHYLDMHQAIASALKDAPEIIEAARTAQ